MFGNQTNLFRHAVIVGN